MESKLQAASPRHPGRLLIAGFLLDRLAGDPQVLHPVAGFGWLAEALERVLWRPSRLAGAAYAALLVGAAVAAVRSLTRAASSGAARAALTVALVWLALGGRSLDRAAAEVQRRLAAGDLGGARRALRALVGRDLTGLPPTALAAAAIESLADNTVDAVVGGAVWYAVWGEGGLWAFRAVNTLDAIVGHRDDRHRRFGTAAARLDDLLVLPAAALAVCGCALLAPLFGSPPAALLASLRQARGHPSPGSGPVQAAFAGVLGVRLGGPRRYANRLQPIPTFGAGRPPSAADIGRARRLSLLLSLLSVGLCAAVAERRGRR